MFPRPVGAIIWKIFESSITTWKVETPNLKLNDDNLSLSFEKLFCYINNKHYTFNSPSHTIALTSPNVYVCVCVHFSVCLSIYLHHLFFT